MMAMTAFRESEREIVAEKALTFHTWAEDLAQRFENVESKVEA